VLRVNTWWGRGRGGFSVKTKKGKSVSVHPFCAGGGRLSLLRASKSQITASHKGEGEKRPAGEGIRREPPAGPKGK